MFSFSFLFFKRKLLLEPSCMEHGDWRRFIGAGLLIDAQSRRRGVSLSLSLFLFGGAGARGVASEIVRSIVATSRWSTCLAPSVGNDSFWFHFCFCFCFFCFYGRRLIHRSVNGDAHFFADAAAVKRFGPVSRTRKNWATWNSNSIGWLRNDLHFATHNNDNNNNNKKQKTNAKRPVGSVALFFSTSHVTWGCLYLAATLNDVISR